MRALLWLDEIGEADQPTVGAKACTLARLRRQGLPVPDGFVLAATAPLATAEDLRAAHARLGGAVAVRSSSTTEDASEASFAGQYLTVLGVRSLEALAEAVVACRRSAAEGRGYGRLLGADTGRMAVLVQRFVEPRAAGVAFTRHPGDPTSVLVEAHGGRGDAVVGGRVRPERYTVDRESGSLRQSPAEGTLDPASLEAIVALALRAERLLGAPQDVEWALGPQGVVLLQARPITVEAEEAQDPRLWRLTRANVGEVLPAPVTPLTWTTLGAFLEHAFRAVAGRVGLLPADAAPFLTLHHRRLYLNLDLCVEVASRLPGVTAGDAERLILGGGAAKRVPGRSAGGAPWGWVLGAARLLRLAAALPREVATAEAAVRELIATGDPESPDPARLHAGLLRFSETGYAFAAAHVATSGSSAFRLALLRRVLAALSPGDPVDLVNRLVAGFPGLASVAPALELESLAAEARAYPEWQTWLSGPAAEAVPEKAGPPAALAEGLRRFLDRFGHRGLSEGELSAQAWGDDPAPVVDALRVLVAAPRPLGFARRAAAEARAADEEALLSHRGPLGRALLRFVLTWARAGVGERERTKAVAVALMHHGRRLARGAGGLLAARGDLARADDVFFLELDELVGALAGERAVPGARVARRRRRHERESGLPAPHEVDLRVAEAASPRREAEDAPRKGLGVSPGVGVGPARVLGPGETPRVEPGEVLVTPVLDAAFGPLLASAAGVVAEIGGLLSHGSVVARELGLPCVVDVADATRWARTGDRLHVDGGRGEVRRQGAIEVAPAAVADEAPDLQPEDTARETLQALEEHRLARESVYFNVQDPGTGLALVSSLGVRPGRHGESILALALPRGRLLFGLDLTAARIDEGAFSVAGARVEWQPLRLRVETRLARHEHAGFPPGPLALLLTPRTVPVSIDLRFIPTTPAIDFCRDLRSEDQNALLPLGRFHLEQSGHWRGAVRIAGETIAVEGTGSRDHSRGRRDWDAADHWRLFTMRLGDDLAVHALAVSVGGRRIEGGFLWREGRAERVTRVLYAAEREEGRVSSLELEVGTARGSLLRLAGVVERRIVVPVQVERRPGRHLAGRPYRLLLHEHFTRFSAEGRVGWGMAELTERPA